MMRGVVLVALCLFLGACARGGVPGTCGKFSNPGDKCLPGCDYKIAGEQCAALLQSAKNLIAARGFVCNNPAYIGPFWRVNGKRGGQHVICERYEFKIYDHGGKRVVVPY